MFGSFAHSQKYFFALLGLKLATVDIALSITLFQGWYLFSAIWLPVPDLSTEPSEFFPRVSQG